MNLIFFSMRQNLYFTIQNNKITKHNNIPFHLGVKKTKKLEKNI